jgi:hypothetical protein
VKELESWSSECKQTPNIMQISSILWIFCSLTTSVSQKYKRSFTNLIYKHRNRFNVHLPVSYFLWALVQVNFTYWLYTARPKLNLQYPCYINTKCNKMLFIFKTDITLQTYNTTSFCFFPRFLHWYQNR